MTCDLSACLFYLFLSILAAIGIYILLDIILYIYIAYITTKYNADDLIRWREDSLLAIDQKYAQMPLDNLQN